MLSFLRKVAVKQTTGLSNSELHDKIASGEFPEPDAYLGPRSPVWLQTTIEAWIKSRLEARGKDKAAHAQSTAAPPKARVKQHAEMKAKAKAAPRKTEHRVTAA